jgi:hypothetical protein
VIGSQNTDNVNHDDVTSDNSRWGSDFDPSLPAHSEAGPSIAQTADKDTDLGASPADDPEVIISFDENGQIHASVNVVSDYIFRGDELEDVTVWDFIARTKKVTKKSVQSKKKKTPEEDNSDSLHNSDLTCEDAGEDIEDANIEESAIDSLQFARPKVLFRSLSNSTHPQSDSHLIYVLHPNNHKVPVPLGPAIPHRDRTEHEQRYSRLMLIKTLVLS